MTLLLKQFYAFFKLLNSDTGTNQISSGLALGIVLGFSPLISLQAFLLFFLAFIFRIQLGAAFLSAFFFKFIAYLLDQPCHLLGTWILENPHLRPLFIQMYNMPLIPLTRFNNTVVMGSFLISFLLSIPLFFIFRIMVVKYRELIVARIQHTRIWKAFSTTKVYLWYLKYQELYG